jgi:hypothetical protein
MQKLNAIDDLLLVTIIKSQVCYEERIPLDTKCLSPPACSELLAVGGFPSAPAAPRQRAEPKRLHSVSNAILLFSNVIAGQSRDSRFNDRMDVCDTPTMKQDEQR